MGLIIAVVLLTVVAFGLALMAPAVFQVTTADNSTKTAQDLESLKISVTGNPRLVISGGRTDFGFIGTMGAVPPQLPPLWQKASQPDYAFDTTRKVGAGWLGPYIRSSFVNYLLSMDKDRFGNPLIYTSIPFARSSDGQMVAARIQSAGLDGTANTSDDQQIDILKAEVFSTVTGALKKGNSPVKFATVTLNAPSNGVLTQTFDITDANGVFQFTDVSFGFRSISIDPKLTYEEGTASTPGNDTLKFTLTNYATNAITITSITPVYTMTAWYQKIKMGNSTVFDYTNAPYNGTRAASGQTITFSSSVTLNGSGKPTQVVPIRVEKETTVTPDVLIKGTGKSIVVQIQEFRNVQTGNGSAVNPSGATFTITFSDGSQNVITVP